MNEQNKIVLRKILYAVESGGQVYGNQDYSCFCGAGANTDNETAITIGAGQWYGVEACRLLRDIQAADEALFYRLDNAGITSDLRTIDWSHYAIAETSDKGQAIIRLISTNTGLKCQDALMDKQITEYAALIGSKYSVTDDRAMMEWVNIIHQGGESAVIRLISNCTDRNNVDSVYQSMAGDTGNQVGAYRSRQRAVYKMIKTYAIKEEEEAMSKGAFKAVELATSREGKNQYTQSGLREQVFSGYSDCSSLWWKAYEKAYNIQIGTWTGEQVDKGTRIALYGGKTALTEADYKKLQVGDLIFFGAGEAQHVEGFAGYRNGVPMLFGHGSGTPSYKNGLTYRHSAKFYQARRYYTETSDTADTIPDTTAEDTKKTTIAYPARMSKHTKCYLGAGTSSGQSKLFPALKKDTLVDVMQYTQKDASGKTWYFVRVPHPSEGFVYEFVPSGSFRHLK